LKSLNLLVDEAWTVKVRSSPSHPFPHAPACPVSGKKGGDALRPRDSPMQALCEWRHACACAACASLHVRVVVFAGVGFRTVPLQSGHPVRAHDRAVWHFPLDGAGGHCRPQVRARDVCVVSPGWREGNARPVLPPPLDTFSSNVVARPPLRPVNPVVTLLRPGGCVGGARAGAGTPKRPTCTASGLTCGSCLPGRPPSLACSPCRCWQRARLCLRMVNADALVSHCRCAGVWRPGTLSQSQVASLVRYRVAHPSPTHALVCAIRTRALHRWVWQC
jgi:hypothetical protein